MQHLPKDVREQITLASIYFADGAPMTAAQKLRDAAAMLDDISSKEKRKIPEPLDMCNDYGTPI